MKPEILVVYKMTDDIMGWLEERYICHKLWEADNQTAFLKSVGAHVRALVTIGRIGFTRAMVEALPKLEMISIHGAGLQESDLDAVRERGLVLTTTPDNSRLAVSDLAMGLLLSVARELSQADAFIKSGAWPTARYTSLGVGVNGKTCGIIGLGVIGMGVAKRAEGFDMTVLYYDPYLKDPVPYQRYDDVRQLAAASDFLMVCCPESPETHHLISAGALAALGPEGILVNVGRGTVVDEAALVEALENGIIKGAGLDVFEHEPDVPEALRSMSNVMLVPHIGTLVTDIRRLRKEKMMENLDAHFAGRPVPWPVAY